MLDWRLCEFVVVREGLGGLGFPSPGVGAVLTAAWRRWARSGMAVVLWWTGCSGVEGADSPRTAVVGRKREAMTMRWLRKEVIFEEKVVRRRCYSEDDVTIDDNLFTFGDAESPSGLSSCRSFVLASNSEIFTRRSLDSASHSARTCRKQKKKTSCSNMEK